MHLISTLDVPFEEVMPQRGLAGDILKRLHGSAWNDLQLTSKTQT